MEGKAFLKWFGGRRTPSKIGGKFVLWFTAKLHTNDSIDATH